ncbi:MAG: ATP-binding protein [Roseburia sp.]|nr:ATP-binding protein [Roseburia sp.]MCM1243346.1 ATP-binding protein [Roseburia sp.]
MYHCRIQFYFIGQKCSLFDVIRETAPLAHFTHEFTKSATVSEDLAADADVIFVNTQELDVAQTLQVLLSCRKETAEIILLTVDGGFAHLEGLEDKLDEISDIWNLSLSKEEMCFRFLRWQQAYKKDRDHWQTNQYLEETINHIPNLVWYKDKDGIHRKVNDSFCRTVNKTKEQVEGQGHAYIWDVEEDDPACIESETEVMTKRETCISEEIIKTGEGMRTLETYKSPLYDLDGSVMGTVGVAIDVTQERAYAQALVRKNQTLEKIFTTIDCGMMRHTLDGAHVISINRAALKILGYDSQEELEAAGFDLVADSVVEEDKERLRACIRELETEGDNIGIEYRVQHKNGDILHVMGNVKLVEENGQLVYQRFLLDCTQQKLQEKKRERRHTELIRALSIDYSLVCFVDLQTGIGTPIQNNAGNEKDLNTIFSKEADFKESMDRYIEDFVYEDDKEMLREDISLDRLKDELSEKKIHYVAYRTFRNGKIKYFQLKAVYAGNEKGSSGIVLGFRSADEEIRKEKEQRALLENALSQANRANKAKSVFLSNMSHDIRTPMNAIVGFTNLAITHIDHREKVEEYLNKISTSGNHLLNLINDVLDMSHIESGKLQLEETPCSLPEILQGLRNILQADVNAKQLSLQIDLVDVADEYIYCDKLRLNQVLLNLMSNSVKYTEAGGQVNVTITEKAGAPIGYANYEFIIRDNGIGMSEEFVQHIFEPFEREKNSTTSGIQGTGLGMAITKNIVELMNGSVSVQSKLGEGSQFTVLFTFRLHTGAEEVQKTPADSASKKGAEDGKTDDKTQQHKGHILLAEDVDLNQEIAVAILGDAGFSTDVADNGKMAVEMLENSEPGYYSLVLMDVQMPVMDGYEATRLIRGLDNKKLASIPIIAMTANAFEEDKKEALQSGMNGHIAKPIDIDKLLQTLEDIMR